MNLLNATILDRKFGRCPDFLLRGIKGDRVCGFLLKEAA
jgi:hypothetical protein